MTNYQQGQGKPIGMEIGVKNSVPYPNEEDRWRLYTDPLTSVLSSYFEKVIVEYCPIEGRLDHFIIRAYDPKFVPIGQNEDKFYNSFFTRLCNDIVNLFLSMRISVQVHDIWRCYQSYEDYMKDMVEKKIGKDPYDDMKSSDIEPMDEDMRIMRHPDGRYCLAVTDKNSGRRCYTEIPEELVKKIGEQHVYRVQ